MPPRPCPAPLPARCYVSTCAGGAGQGGMLLRDPVVAALRPHGEACPRVLALFNRTAAGGQQGCSPSWISSHIRRDPSPTGNPRGRSWPCPRRQGPELRSKAWVWGKKIGGEGKYYWEKIKLIVGVFFRPVGGAQAGREGEGAEGVAARSKEVNSRRGSEESLKENKTKAGEKIANFNPCLRQGRGVFGGGKAVGCPVLRGLTRCSRFSLQVPVSEPLGPQPAGP